MTEVKGESANESANAELPSLKQLEDAAADALATLIANGLEWYLAEDYLVAVLAAGPDQVRGALRDVARELLRGPLDAWRAPSPGGYCMRAPADPRLAALLHAGSQIVETAYTVRNPQRAYAAALDLLAAADPKGDLP